MRKKWLIILSLILSTAACKKAFTPEGIKSDNNQYLVIEGIVNNGIDSTFIKLSRTQKIDTVHNINPERNAVVSIESSTNHTYQLSETTAGTYAAAPMNLDPAAKYRLRIKTSDNKEYLSDFVVVKNAPPIDSVGFVAKSDGVDIYVNTHDATNSTHYYRWEYNEDWQFHSQYASTLYSNGVDGLKARDLSQEVHDCFGSDVSSDILVANSNNLTHDIIDHAPIIKISPTSEKIETKYSILVKQFALTSDAYTFWDNLQRNTQNLGSIFDILPSMNESNFHCLTNPNELVVGYLSVGTSTSKRIFITPNQLLPAYSAMYPVGCKIDTAFVNPPHPGTIPIAELIPTNSPYVPILGLHLTPPGTGPFDAYTYSTILCVDCTVRGSRTQPAFWK
jgi:hypothetical protein